MRHVNGWHLPDSDEYFSKFAVDGFQLDHLRAAFKYVKNWTVAVDCGAHIGFWTRDMAERFKTVYAFEPAADTYSCLAKNMETHPNVVLHNVAVGAKTGRCRVREDDRRIGNTGARYVVSDGDVEMTALDNFGFEHCGLLKIDVEGYEFQVIEGGRKMIESCRPVIIMETDKRFALARYGVADDAAEKALLAMDYREAVHMRPDKIFVSR